MAFDEVLAARMRKYLGTRAGFVEKKMFGGVAFLVRGNMCVGVHKDEMIVRIDPHDTTAAVKKPGARLFDITGRPMKGWILVEPYGLRGAGLAKWIKRASAYAGSLPKKK